VHYEVEVEGQVRKVIVDRVGDHFAIAVDGREWSVDAARIDGQTLSLIIEAVSRDVDTPEGGGASYEVGFSPGSAPGTLLAQVGPTAIAVTLNGRRRRRDDAGQSAGGPQRVAAPMPGKVVRLLVQPGQKVGARQPLVVVEAMKMENELRAVRPGVVAEIHVKEGASVDAGALLLVLQET
jgi:biotin carboxyl carrier protein